MKKSLLALASIASSISSFAEQTETVQKTFRQDPFKHPSLPTFVATLFAGAVVILLVVVGIYLMRVTKFLKTQAKSGTYQDGSPRITVTSISIFKGRRFYSSLGLISILVLVLTLTGIIHV